MWRGTLTSAALGVAELPAFFLRGSEYANVPVVRLFQSPEHHSLPPGKRVELSAAGGRPKGRTPRTPDARASCARKIVVDLRRVTDVGSFGPC